MTSRTLKSFDTLDSAIVKLAEMIKADPKSNWGPPENGIVIREIYPARYDLAAINNIARQVGKHVPLTDRQQGLTIKLVTKYHKQWRKKGYDVSNIDLNTPTVFPIRKGLDRKLSVSVEGNMVTLKFPYKPRLIRLIGEFAQHSCGRIEWNQDAKQWEIAATDGNITWIDKFVNDHKFTQDDSYKSLIELMNNAFDYKDIQLDIVDDKLVIHNAPITMSAWIQENIGDLSMDNFIQIVSASSLLVFALSDSVIQYAIDNHEDIADLVLMRRTFINSDETALIDVLKRVNKLQYKNVVLFVSDPATAGNYVQVIRKAMPNYNVVVVDNAGGLKQKWNTIYVTGRVIPVDADLIISLAGFMAGPSRRIWFNSARKNIYYCQDIDNKIKKQLKKDESNINYKRRDEC